MQKLIWCAGETIEAHAIERPQNITIKQWCDAEFKSQFAFMVTSTYMGLCQLQSSARCCTQAVTCGDDVENGKPAPDCFLSIAKELGTAPEDCLVIEDAPAGELLTCIHASESNCLMTKAMQWCCLLQHWQLCLRHP